VSVGGQYIRD